MSIIIPIYNQEAYLEECLSSIINQSGIDYEVILVNDGSTDGSEDICRKYTRRYSNFKYIYQNNAGLGEARNTGLTYAHGKYLLFLDSDDAIQKNSIGKLFSYAEENAADIVYFDEMVCDEKLAVQSIVKTYQGMDTRILKLKALELSMHPSHICARLYKRRIFDNTKFANIWYEDMEIFPQLIAKAERLYYYKVPIYYYRQHKKGITYQETDKRNLEVITAWQNAYTKAAYSGKEKEALGICIKRSIFDFIFFRLKYASEYMEFYNRVFAVPKTIFSGENCVDIVDIHSIPLWQQADFYGKTEILDILTGLENIYQYGGILRFYRNEAVEFQKEDIQENRITFYLQEEIVLEEIRVQKRNPAIFEVIKICSQWNLISLKNQIKKFKIEKIVMEQAILNGIKINVRSI